MAILVIDASVESRQALVELIKWADGRRNVSVAETGASGWETALETEPELVICDPILPDISGDTLCQRLRGRLPDSSFLAYSSEIEPYPPFSSIFDGVLSKPPSRLAILPHLFSLSERKKKSRTAGPVPDRELAMHTDIKKDTWGRKPVFDPCAPRILVRMVDETQLRFSVPIPRCATVEVVLRQLGKRDIGAFTLIRGSSPIPTLLDTRVHDGDELRLA